MKPHRIRLAGPWEWQPLTGSSGVAEKSEPQTCRLPFPSASDVIGHGILLRRRFHCPTGIGPGTTIAMILETRDVTPEVWMNEQILAGVKVEAPIEEPNSDNANQWRFDISAPLKPYNELQIRLIPSFAGCFPSLCAAALEIHEPQ